jgi:hypothetical protein
MWIGGFCLGRSTAAGQLAPHDLLLRRHFCLSWRAVKLSRAAALHLAPGLLAAGTCPPNKIELSGQPTPLAQSRSGPHPRSGLAANLPLGLA